MPRWLTYLLLALGAVAIILAIAAPIGPMPGFRVGGSPAEPPASWVGAQLPDEVRFGTYDGFLPYVVTIWVVESGGSLYVVGDPASTWVKKATNSSDVRIRIGDSVYDMQARRMPAGRVDVLQAYVDRYKADYPEIINSFPPLPEFAQGSALFELTPR
jgi:hypothetical protein